MNREKSFPARAHAQLSNMQYQDTLECTTWRELLERCSIYIQKLSLLIKRVEWTKGICHIWSRGRLISPSMLVGDDWYLKLSSQKRSPGRNLGEHRSVRRSGTASRGTALLVFCLRMRSFPRTEVRTIFLGKKYPYSSTNTQHRLLTFPGASLLHHVHIPVVWS